MEGWREEWMGRWMDGQLGTWALKDSVSMGAAWKGEGLHRPVFWNDPTFTLIFTSSTHCQNLHEDQSPSPRHIF